MRLPPERKSKRAQHVVPVVYREMLLQIALDYHSLPDVRTLTMSEIRFFYEGLRASLRKHTAPSNK